jgi:hypothetical protein
MQLSKRWKTLQQQSDIWGDDADAMGQHGTNEISIEQYNDTTDTSDPKPYGLVFRAVRHQETDDFTFS